VSRASQHKQLAQLKRHIFHIAAPPRAAAIAAAKRHKQNAAPGGSRAAFNDSAQRGLDIMNGFRTDDRLLLPYLLARQRLYLCSAFCYLLGGVCWLTA